MPQILHAETICTRATIKCVPGYRWVGSVLQQKLKYSIENDTWSETQGECVPTENGASANEPHKEENSIGSGKIDL